MNWGEAYAPISLNYFHELATNLHQLRQTSDMLKRIAFAFPPHELRLPQSSPRNAHLSRLSD